MTLITLPIVACSPSPDSGSAKSILWPSRSRPRDNNWLLMYNEAVRRLSDIFAFFLCLVASSPFYNLSLFKQSFVTPFVNAHGKGNIGWMYQLLSALPALGGAGCCSFMCFVDFCVPSISLCRLQPLPFSTQVQIWSFCFLIFFFFFWHSPLPQSMNPVLNAKHKKK